MSAVSQMLEAPAEPRAATLVVDARERQGAFGPGRILCGLPLVARHVLAAGYDGGFGRVVVVTSPATRAEVEAALAGRAAPKVAVELVSELPADDGGRQVMVDAREVVTRPDLRRLREGEVPAAPRLIVTSQAGAATGRRRLFGAIAKSMEMDGLLCYFFVRPASRVLVRMMLPARITPNMVSVTAGLFGLAASVVVMLGGGLASSLLPLGLLWVAMTLDCCDGDVARMKFQFSRAGEWIDTLGDEISQITLVAALGIGLYREGRGIGWLGLGVGAAGVMLMTAIAIYVTLHRRKMPVNSAMFPWFFGKPGGDADSPRGLVGILSWGFRRDFFITTIGILCALDLRMPALWVMAGGAAIVGGLMLAHQIRDAPASGYLSRAASSPTSFTISVGRSSAGQAASLAGVVSPDMTSTPHSPVVRAIVRSVSSWSPTMAACSADTPSRRVAASIMARLGLPMITGVRPVTASQAAMMAAMSGMRPVRVMHVLSGWVAK